MEFEYYPKRTVIALIGLFGIIVMIFGFLTHALQRENDEKTGTINQQQQELLQIKQNLDLLTKVSWVDILQHQVEGTVGTDRYIVRKITFGGDTFTGKLSATIELDTLSDAAALNKAPPQADPTNQDLSAQLNAILTGVSKFYDNFKDKNTKFPDWTTGEFSIKAGGRLLGTYSKGELKLADGTS